MTRTNVILALRDVSVRFGGVRAVDGVSLDLGAGCAVGLIGPNGAGKSTLLGAISGRLPVATGTVSFRGADCTILAEEVRVGLGIASTFQRTRMYDSLSAAETIAVALPARSGTRAARNGEARRILELHGLGGLADRPAAELTASQARFLDVARAVATGPGLLLADEPFAGLDAADSDRMLALLLGLRSAGAALVVVEHRLDRLLRVADRVTVLVRGRIAGECLPADLLSRNDCLAAYLGMTDDG